MDKQKDHRCHELETNPLFYWILYCYTIKKKYSHKYVKMFQEKYQLQYVVLGSKKEIH